MLNKEEKFCASLGRDLLTISTLFLSSWPANIFFDNLFTIFANTQKSLSVLETHLVTFPERNNLFSMFLEVTRRGESVKIILARSRFYGTCKKICKLKTKN